MGDSWLSEAAVRQTAKKEKGISETSPLAAESPGSAEPRSCVPPAATATGRETPRRRVLGFPCRRPRYFQSGAEIDREQLPTAGGGAWTPGAGARRGCRPRVVVVVAAARRRRFGVQRATGSLLHGVVSSFPCRFLNSGILRWVSWARRADANVIGAA